MNFCRECQKPIPSQFEYCYKCKNKHSKSITQNNSSDFLGMCEKCGSEGRKIENFTDKSITYRCYECYTKEKNVGCMSYEKGKTEDEVKDYYKKNYCLSRYYYDLGLVEHYLKPLFYGREPNHKKLDELWDDVLTEMMFNVKLRNQC